MSSDRFRSRSLPPAVFVYEGCPYDPPTTEYTLPCDKMPATVRKALDPWLRQMVGLSPKEAATRLRERWAHVAIPCLRELREVFLEDYSPRAIFTHNKEAWLGIARGRRVPGESDCDILLLPPPSRKKPVQQGLKKCPFANTATVLSFINEFGSLRETIPPYNGYFKIPNEWETLFEYWGENEGRYGEWYAEWREALIIYGFLSGDMVLLHPNGALVWLDFAQNEIWELGKSFDAFIHRYAAYRRKSSFALQGDILDELD